MLNLIRMEITRIFKSKSSLYIFLAILLAFGLMIGLVQYTTKNIDEIEATQNMEENVKDDQNGINVKIDEDKLNDLTESGEDFVISSYSQTTYLIFLIVFGSIFFTGPYTNGFIKNFLGMTKSKSSYVFSTFIVASLYVIVTFVVGAAIVTLAAPRINDGMFVFTNYGRLFKILFVELLNHLSYLSFILLIASITRSTSITLMITFLYPTIFFNFISGITTNFIGLFIDLPEDFLISNYVNIGNIISKTFASTNYELNRAIIVALVIGVVSLLVSSVIIKKKDI